MPVETRLARRVRLAGPLALATVAAAGCSWFPHHRAEQGPVVVAPAPARATAGASAPAAAGEAQTATSNLPDLPDEPAAAAAAPAAPAAPEVISGDAAAIAATAPKSYEVRKGDTLWGLAQVFLKDPWKWPEIWHINPEVRNPHRIYPGDTLRLVIGANGQQQLVVDHAGGAPVTLAPAASGPITALHPLLRAGDEMAPIDVLPRAAITSFLSRPGVLAAEQVKRAPYIVALRGEHVIAGSGDDAYARNLAAREGARYDVMHVGAALKARGVGKVGHVAQYAGTIEVKRAGDPALVHLVESAREVLAGDVLVPSAANETPDVVPHLPGHAVNSSVLAVVNGVLLAGQYQVIAISGGTSEGLEPGHVLRVDEAVQRAQDRCAKIEGTSTCLTARNVALPAEAAGTLLVFRSFEHMSYALVMSETSPLHVGDHVVRP